MFRVPFAVLFLFSLTFSAFSQNYIVNTSFIDINNKILLFQKNDALLQIQKSKELQPKNLLFDFLESNVLFIDAFLSETQKSKNEFFCKCPDWEIRLKSGDRTSPFYRYCIAHLLLKKSVLSVKHGEFVKAGLDVRKAFILLEENKQQFPYFIWQLMELGMLHALLGNIPEQYTWLLGIAGMNGDIFSGKNELKKTLNLSLNTKDLEYLQTESFLYNAALAVILGSDRGELNQLIQVSQQISAKFHKSPLYIFTKALLYEHLNQNENAIEELKNFTQSDYQMRFDYLDYMHGVLLLQKSDNNAVNYLNRFAANFKGLHYIKSCYHKIAWFYLLKGNNEKYTEYMKLVSAKGNSVYEPDKLAQKESETGKVPQPELLRARLFCDGGYYAESIVQLESIDTAILFRNKLNKIEYYYRYARIYDLQNNQQTAVKYYLKTIELGRNEKEYFAANASLLLGNYFESINKKSDATFYYKQCLNFPNTEYRNSIQQKAKAGMQRLQK